MRWLQFALDLLAMTFMALLIMAACATVAMLVVEVWLR